MVIMKRNNKLGIVLSWLVAVIPVGLVFVFSQASPPSSLSQAINGVGRLAGIVGLSLYAWNLILSARIGVIERQFGGLDKLYKSHHMIGGIAFILLLIHPLLIVGGYAVVSLASVYQLLVPNFDDLALQAGKVALGGLIGVLFITFYAWVSHERFMWIHRLTGVFFAVGVYHAFFVSGSRVLQIQPLAWYLAILSITAIALFAYRFVFKSVRPRRKFRVESVKDLGGAWELVLKPVRRGIEHKAGQFAFVTLIGANIPQQTHPFTIASGQSENNLRFTIKNLGDFTAQLGSLKAGDVAFVEGPYGTFNYHAVGRKKQVWIAGGIGITPFLAMARSLAKSDGVDAHLFYSVAEAKQAYHADELAKLAKESGGHFSFTLHDSSKQGLLDAELISKQLADVRGREVMICGPGGMMKALRQQFTQQGVEKNHIQSEEFSFL